MWGAEGQRPGRAGPFGGGALAASDMMAATGASAAASGRRRRRQTPKSPAHRLGARFQFPGQIGTRQRPGSLRLAVDAAGGGWATGIFRGPGPPNPDSAFDTQGPPSGQFEIFSNQANGTSNAVLGVIILLRVAAVSQITAQICHTGELRTCAMKRTVLRTCLGGVAVAGA